MRFGAVSTITFFLATGMAACVPKSPTSEATPGSGGASGTTSSTSSGATGGGGSSPNGGSPAGGAGSPNGGSSAGGANSAAGAKSSGGTSLSQGGASAGVAGAAGGGLSPGGAVSAGGSTSAGGASGSCTDVTAPGQPQTCADWLSYGMCSQDWFKDYCNKTCGRCSGTSAGGAAASGGASSRGGSTGVNSSGGAASSGGASSRGGSGGTNSLGGANSSGGSNASGGSVSTGTNPPITGSNGFATRYWDCCKPSCSWTTSVPSCGKDGTSRITDKNAQSGCAGGTAYECYDFSPWYDASTNMSYGFAAYNASSCGVCYQLQFTGEGDGNASALKGQQMIVQAINIGNIGAGQFDLLIPGGGVGQQTNGCPAQWGSSTDLGQNGGGLLAECKDDPTCMKGKCQSVFGSMPGLLAGCNWFTGWYNSADNPKLIYKQVTCPSQITSKSGVSG